MKTHEVTITSKNQITLPAEIVRSLKLSKNRILELKVKGNSIYLTPEQEILDMVRPFWAKHQAKQALSSKQLKQATRDAITRRVAK